MAQVKQRLDTIGWTRHHNYLFAVCGYAWMADLLWQLNLQVLLEERSTDWGLSVLEASLLSTTFMGGMTLGSYAWGVLGDSKGRTFAFKLTSVPILLGGSWLFVATRLWMLFLSLFLIGLGAGGEVSVSTTVYSEYCPPKKSWTLALLGVCWCVGGVASPAIVVATSAVTMKSGWCWVLGGSLGTTLLALLLRLPIKETPCYLFAQHRLRECAEVLSGLSKSSVTLRWESPARLTPQLKSSRWTILVFSLLYFGASLASAAVLLFMPALVRSIEPGISTELVFLVVVAQQSAGVPAVFLAAWLINTGCVRKWAMSLAYVLSGVCLLLFMVSSSLQWAVMTSMGMVFCSYIGYSVMYAMLPEVCHTSVRNTVLGVCNALSKLGAVVSPLVYAYLVALFERPELSLTVFGCTYILIGLFGTTIKEPKSSTKTCTDAGSSFADLTECLLEEH